MTIIADCGRTDMPFPEDPILELTIPDGAKEDDARVYVGENNEAAQYVGSAASITFSPGPPTGDNVQWVIGSGPWDNVNSTFRLVAYDTVAPPDGVEYDSGFAYLQFRHRDGIAIIGPGSRAGSLNNDGFPLTLVRVEADTVELGSLFPSNTDDVKIYQRSLGRGVVYHESPNTVVVVGNPSGGAAEGVVWTTPSISFKPRRAYKVDVELNIGCNTANAWVHVALRRGSTTGAQLLKRWERTVTTVLANNGYHTCLSTKFVNSNNSSGISTPVCLTLQSSAGIASLTSGSHAVGYWRSLTITDIGAASDYPDLPSVF